jgi:hypothetical protein
MKYNATVHQLFIHFQEAYDSVTREVKFSEIVSANFCCNFFLLMLYFSLLRSKPDYASVAWRSITVSNSNKLLRTQIKFVALCGGRLYLVPF